MEGVRVELLSVRGNVSPRRPARREHQLADDARQLGFGLAQQKADQPQNLVLRNRRDGDEIGGVPNIGGKCPEIGLE